jgi:uncharacterized protein (TIGR03118 family)
MNHFSRRQFLSTCGAGLIVAGCGGGDEIAGELGKKSYIATALAATDAKYKAKFIFPEMVDAWGIAIRPAGAGGHFWVTGGGTSWQFVGDVQRSPEPTLRTLFQDGLAEVYLPGADSLITDASIGKATGTVFNGAALNSNQFRVTNQKATVAGVTRELEGSARFVFVTDSGVVSAWTDREKSSGDTLRVNGPCQEVFNGSEAGMQFFGCAIRPDAWDALWLADFGDEPQIRTLDANWKLTPTVGFVNPFATGANNQAKPDDPVPFNVQVLEGKVYVAYAISKAAEGSPAEFDAGEEDALSIEDEAKTNGRPNKGKVAVFSLAGQLLSKLEDDGRLNAPWGLAIAPADFGQFSGALLVGNFGGAGKIAAYNLSAGKFIDYVRDSAGEPLAIEGLWALQFGNGVSLGDSNALYYAAGPAEEKEGVFGSIRVA